MSAENKRQPALELLRIVNQAEILPSYWDLFRAEMKPVLLFAVTSQLPQMNQRVRRVFGDTPLTTVELLDRRGTFGQVSPRHLDVMLLYFSVPLIPLTKIGKMLQDPVSDSRITQIIDDVGSKFRGSKMSPPDFNVLDLTFHPDLRRLYLIELRRAAK